MPLRKRHFFSPFGFRPCSNTSLLPVRTPISIVIQEYEIVHLDSSLFVYSVIWTRRTQACNSSSSSSFPCGSLNSLPPCHSPTTRPSYPQPGPISLAPCSLPVPVPTSLSSVYSLHLTILNLPIRPSYNEGVYMRPRRRVIRLVWRGNARGSKNYDALW
jgi:hypothetical protein